MDHSRTFPLTSITGRLPALLADHLAVIRIIFGGQGKVVKISARLLVQWECTRLEKVTESVGREELDHRGRE